MNSRARGTPNSRRADGQRDAGARVETGDGSGKSRPLVSTKCRWKGCDAWAIGLCVWHGQLDEEWGYAS